MWFENVVPLPVADSGLQHSIVRFHNSHIDSRRQDRSRFWRREPVLIINLATGDRVLRYPMGTPGGISVKRIDLALDYDAADALNVRFYKPVQLEVRRARTHEVYLWFWSHPDQSVRHSIRLGLFGGLMGVMGFLTGVLPLIF